MPSSWFDAVYDATTFRPGQVWTIVDSSIGLGSRTITIQFRSGDNLYIFYADVVRFGQRIELIPPVNDSTDAEPSEDDDVSAYSDSSNDEDSNFCAG